MLDLSILDELIVTAIETFKAALPLLLRLFFIVYPVVTNVAFDAFSCYNLGRDEQGQVSLWLKADISIQCDEAGGLGSTRARAWVAIVIYPFGLLALNAILLYKARRAIRKERLTELSRSTAFLHQEYRKELFWWELVEMLRRLLLVGLMVLLQGSMMQMIVGTVLAVAFLLFQVQASPYKSFSDSFLASTTNFCLVIIFIVSYAFKDYEFAALPDIKMKMSIEQQQVYVIKQLDLTLIAVLTTVFSLVFAFFLFVVQLIAEAKRHHFEVLANRSRRLRLKVDSTMVDVPAIAANSYHVFLSHVWSSGQDQMRIVKQRLVEMLPELVVFLDVDGESKHASVTAPPPFPSAVTPRLHLLSLLRSDLKEIGSLEEYVKRTSNMLVYCTKGYLTSRNCQKELIASTRMAKPIITLVDMDKTRGDTHMSPDDIHATLIGLDETFAAVKNVREESAEGGANSLETSVSRRRMAHEWPGGQMVYGYLFSSDPISWNRIGHFQDVTMRVIAERMLSLDPGTTFVDRELVSRDHTPLASPSIGDSRVKYHVYCSDFNPGAAGLMKEFADQMTIELLMDAPDVEVDTTEADVLRATTAFCNMLECQHFLLYLTSETWTSGDLSQRLVEEIHAAMDRGVHILLAHEMYDLDQESHHGCEFGTFFSTTPEELLLSNIYAEVAVPLKSGVWRETSMALLAHAMAIDTLEDHSTLEVATLLPPKKQAWYRASDILNVFKLKRQAKSIQGVVKWIVSPGNDGASKLDAQIASGVATSSCSMQHDSPTVHEVPPTSTSITGASLDITHGP